jgi:hypothetical protein
MRKLKEIPSLSEESVKYAELAANIAGGTLDPREAIRGGIFAALAFTYATLSVAEETSRSR